MFSLKEVRDLMVKDLSSKVMKSVGDARYNMYRMIIIDLNPRRGRTYMLQVWKKRHRFLEKNKENYEKKNVHQSLLIMEGENLERRDGDIFFVSSYSDRFTYSWILDLACFYYMTIKVGSTSID